MAEVLGWEYKCPSCGSGNVNVKNGMMFGGGGAIPYWELHCKACGKSLGKNPDQDDFRALYGKGIVVVAKESKKLGRKKNGMKIMKQKNNKLE